ncbi:cell envelope integrity protein TolA [Methylophilus methylotrophus]|uniref:cell envelope integrity protein TolA n=1 Tax=Methylophilus methylotrophus TaxID=17 RepID=UPI000F5ACF36|nr:cell envelope integrity protein TolA [Methylophilus methylotrophus]
MKIDLSPQDQAIRKRAAVLSVLMHVLLFLGMIFMVDWKAVHVNPSVMEATLWDSLPSKQPAKPVTKPVEPTPPPPEPEPKPEPKPPEPEPPPPQPKPDPQVKQAEQEAQIALKKQEDEKKKQLEEQKKKELEQKKQEEKLKKIQEALRKQEEEDKLKKIQEALRQQDMEAQQAAAANGPVDQDIFNYYMGLLIRKIRSNVNPGLCPVSNPALLFEIQLTSSGDLSGMPKLVKGSGDAVCDTAVMRAILAAKPFDLPGEDHPAERKKMLDEIRATFKPRG